MISRIESDWRKASKGRREVGSETFCEGVWILFYKGLDF